MPDNYIHDSKKPRIAFYFGTRNFYHMMALSLKSLLTHTYMDKVYFIIEDSFFPEPLPPLVQCVNVSNQTFFPHDGPNFNSIFSYMMLIRVAIPLMFPDIDVALSIDADTLVKHDIDALWDINLGNNYYAAVQELFSIHGKQYFNNGVSLINFKQMRDDGICERAIRMLNERKYRWCEQDVMNELCAGRILKLPSAYNFAPGVTERTDEFYIRHYIGMASKGAMMRAAVEYEDVSWNEIVCKGSDKP